MTSLAQKAKKVKSMEAQVTSYQARIDKLKEEITQELEKLGVKTIEIDGVKITYVHPEKWEYPESVLKEKLPSQVFNRLFKKVFDANLLQDEVLAGHITPELVESLAIPVETKAYPRITIKKE